MTTQKLLAELEYIVGQCGPNPARNGVAPDSTEAQSPQAAARLFALGLVDRYQQGEYCVLLERRRTYFLYRPTAKGKAALAEHRGA